MRSMITHAKTDSKLQLCFNHALHKAAIPLGVGSSNELDNHSCVILIVDFHRLLKCVTILRNWDEVNKGPPNTTKIFIYIVIISFVISIQWWRIIRAGKNEMWAYVVFVYSLLSSQLLFNSISFFYCKSILNLKIISIVCVGVRERE